MTRARKASPSAEIPSNVAPAARSPKPPRRRALHAAPTASSSTSNRGRAPQRALAKSSPAPQRRRTHSGRNFDELHQAAPAASFMALNQRGLLDAASAEDSSTPASCGFLDAERCPRTSDEPHSGSQLQCCTRSNQRRAPSAVPVENSPNRTAASSLTNPELVGGPPRANITTPNRWRGGFLDVGSVASSWTPGGCGLLNAESAKVLHAVPAETSQPNRLRTSGAAPATSSARRQILQRCTRCNELKISLAPHNGDFSKEARAPHCCAPASCSAPHQRRAPRGRTSGRHLDIAAADGFQRRTIASSQPPRVGESQVPQRCAAASFFMPHQRRAFRCRISGDLGPNRLTTPRRRPCDELRTKASSSALRAPRLLRTRVARRRPATISSKGSQPCQLPAVPAVSPPRPHQRRAPRYRNSGPLSAPQP